MPRYAVVRDGRVVRVLRRVGSPPAGVEVREVAEHVRVGFVLAPGGGLVPARPVTDRRRAAAGLGIVLAVAVVVTVLASTVCEHPFRAVVPPPFYAPVEDTGEGSWNSSSWGRP